jgi:hypothetical protein
LPEISEAGYGAARSTGFETGPACAGLNRNGQNHRILLVENLDIGYGTARSTIGAASPSPVTGGHLERG